MIEQTLATARLTRLITEDSITEPIRDRAMAANPRLGELVQCRSCSSIWAALAVAALSRTAPVVVRTLALSETVVLLREKF